MSLAKLLFTTMATQTQRQAKKPSLQEADPGPKDGLSVGPQGIILPSGESCKFGICF